MWLLIESVFGFLETDYGYETIDGSESLWPLFDPTDYLSWTPDILSFNSSLDYLWLFYFDFYDDLSKFIEFAFLRGDTSVFIISAFELLLWNFCSLSLESVEKQLPSSRICPDVLIDLFLILISSDFYLFSW